MAETYFEGTRYLHQKASEQKFLYFKAGEDYRKVKIGNAAVYETVNPEYMEWLEQRVKTLESECAGLELMLQEDQP